MPNIKIESTDKALSSYGGLFLFNKVFNGSKFETVVGRALPRLKSGTQKSFNKFKHLVMAFGAGAHCLDDIIPLSLDDGFSAVCGDDVYSPKSYGDFLRSFSSLQAKEINQSMAANAYHLRSEFVSKQKSITIDLDSTPNVQHGTKMEGAA